MLYERADGENVFSDIRLDAGFGAALKLKTFGDRIRMKPLTVRFDIPFYLSHAPFKEKDNIKFRWVIGVNRAF
jgi:aminopeptidase N